MGQRAHGRRYAGRAIRRQRRQYQLAVKGFGSLVQMTEQLLPLVGATALSATAVMSRLEEAFLLAAPGGQEGASDPQMGNDPTEGAEGAREAHSAAEGVGEWPAG